MRRAIIRTSDELDRLCRIAAASYFALMLVFIAIQVVARYLLQEPPTWTEELARFAMVWGGLLGATISFKSRTDPVLMPPPGRRGSLLARSAGLARAGAVLIFLAPVLYFSLFGPGMNFARGFLARSAQRTADTLGFPMSYIAAAVPVMAIVVLVHLLARAAAKADGTGEAQP